MIGRAHQIQVSITVEKPSHMTVTREFLNGCLHFRSASGEDPKGVTINAIIWTVNGRENKYESDADITEVLNKMFKMGIRPTFQQMG